MRILHYYPSDDSMVSQHVKLLTEGMGLEVESHSITQSADALKLLKGSHYDILHLHGCWSNSSRMVVNVALKLGTRLVLTPHGGLEPWIQEEHYWTEKLPKRLLYQRDIVRKAYVVILQGRMEQECMQQLGWNPRMAVIRNCVITCSTTQKTMARQTYAVYRKVMDSNPLELMTEESKTALRHILRVGITENVQWLPEGAVPVIVSQWRQLLCYAHQEQIKDTVERGIRILALNAPDYDTEKIDYYLPANCRMADSIQATIGNQFVSENERLLATFRYLRKLTANRQLSIKHIAELSHELQHHSCEEDELRETLEERHQLKFVAQLMQLLHDLTGLTEGFMPVAPLNDRNTRRLRKQIDNHLKI